MMKMKALLTFSTGGAKLTFQGEVFEVAEGRVSEYERLGLAERVDGETKQEPKNSPTLDIAKTDYTEDELKEMKAKDLKEIAKNIGVFGYGGMTKAELIFAIRAQQEKNKGA